MGFPRINQDKYGPKIRANKKEAGVYQAGPLISIRARNLS